MKGHSAKKVSRLSSRKAPPPPADKDADWWQTIKAQLNFVMRVTAGKGKSHTMITDRDAVYINVDLPSGDDENLRKQKSILCSLWRKLTPTLMRYLPQLYNIKRRRSSEKLVQDWLEAMPDQDKCKTDDTVEALWWPISEEKVTELITESTTATATYIPRKERKPGNVDPMVKMYSDTTQLVPYKECCRSLVDLRTLENKRRNRQHPKTRFSKNNRAVK